MNIGGCSGGGGMMSIPSSTIIARKRIDPGSDPFPVGLRVLVVDDDPTCLIILEKMLRTCRYDVTKTNRAEVALTLLRENRNGFDVVISDVHMPDMDGFKLLEHVGLEMDLPVIMMSADDSKSVVMKGVTHGACDYLIKPVRIEALKNIWQHVVRKKKNEWKEVEQSSSYDDEDRQHKPDDTVSSPATEGSWKSSKRKNEDDDQDEKDDTSTLKKPRVVWSVELHQQFVAAVNQLGIEKAVPKKILELMNVPGLTRENVASHLQKYRLYLRRLSGVSQHQGGLNTAFMSQDSGFAAMSQLSGIDLQSLHASGQLSAQTLAAYTRMPPIKPNNISIQFPHQRNLFSFENTPLQQQQQQQRNVNKQVNLLHGIPTTIESKQLSGSSHSPQNLRNVNIPMGPQQSNRAYLPDLPGNSFPLESMPGLTSMVAKRFNQVENNQDMKSVGGYVGSYEVQPHRGFGGAPQNSGNVGPAGMVNQDYGLSHTGDQNGNVLGGSPVFSPGLDNQHLGMQNINHNVNGVVIDNVPRVKAETNVFSEHYGQDDLMCAIMKQQGGIASVDYEFDGYSLDNIPV